MAIAYSYRRFSSAAQASGDSLARQTELSESYCSQNGLTLSTDTFEDLGISGYSGANLEEGSALSEFLAAVKSGRIASGSHLLIEAFDRLTRLTPNQALPLLMSLMTSGITVVTLQDGKRYSAETMAMDLGSLLMSVMGLFVGHEESRRKSLRLTAVYDRKRQTADNRIRLPFWIERQADGMLALKQPEASHVARIFTLAADEGLGSRAIATRLNAEGIVSPNGKRWAPSSVARILRSRSVIGEYVPHTAAMGSARKPIGSPIRHFYPVLVDAGTFVKVMKAQRSSGPKTTAAGPANLFSGLLHCTCGAPMHFKRGSKRDSKNRLFCPLRCGQPSIPYEHFEVLTVLGFMEALYERIDNEISPQTQIDQQEARQEELRSQIRNLGSAIAKVGDTPELIEQLVRLKHELASVQHEVEDAVDDQYDEFGGIVTWKAVAGQEYFMKQDDPTFRRQLEAVIRRWIKTGKLVNRDGKRLVVWTITDRRTASAGESERELPVSFD